MNKKTLSLILSTIVVFSGANIAFAQTTQPVKEKIKETKTADLSKIITRADQEITRRTEALTKLSTRVSEMKKVSIESKAILSEKIQAEQANLNVLKTKIDSAVDKEALKADIKSITESYRIFMLIMPQIQVLTAVDRINTISATMTDVGTKLQTRITEAETQGKDVTELQKLMANYNTKVADAKTKASTASAYVSNLTPDNGDNAVKLTNTEALKKARADIKVAHEALQNARQDAKKMMEILRGEKKNKNATTTPER